MSWDATTNMTQMDKCICLLLMFLLRAFYCIQTNPLCKLYIMEELSSRNWCINLHPANIFYIQIIPTWVQSDPIKKNMLKITRISTLWHFHLFKNVLLFISQTTYHVGVLITQFLTFFHTTYTPIISFKSHSITIINNF